MFKMAFIEHKWGCRSCLSSDGITQLIQLTGIDDSEFENKTEFEVVKYLENLFAEDKYCVFCNSNNYEIHDIKIGNNLLYDFNKLVKHCIQKNEIMFTISMKKENGICTGKLGGSSLISSHFKITALRECENIIAARNDNFFQPLKNGSLYLNITGKYNENSKKYTFKTQKLRHVGISKSEILAWNWLV